MQTVDVVYLSITFFPSPYKYSSEYNPSNIFCCSYAPYFYEGIKLRFPEYTRTLQNENELENAYFTAKAEADIKASDLVNGKAELKVNMKVTDKWGMVMTKTYTVTIKK